MHLVALRFEVFGGKRSPILEMPACVDRTEHKVDSSIVSFFPSQTCSPTTSTATAARTSPGPSPAWWQASEDELGGWWWLGWAFQRSPTPWPQYSGLAACTPWGHRGLCEWSLCVLSHKAEGQCGLETKFFNLKITVSNHSLRSLTLKCL